MYACWWVSWGAGVSTGKLLVPWPLCMQPAPQTVLHEAVTFPGHHPNALTVVPAGGEVLCAWLRRPADDSMAALLQPKRRRHALATSFAILDARTYSEIANVQVRWCSLKIFFLRSCFCAVPICKIQGAVLHCGQHGSIKVQLTMYQHTCGCCWGLQTTPAHPWPCGLIGFCCLPSNMI